MSIVRLKMFSTLLWALTSAHVTAQATPSAKVPPSWCEDAELRDVFFVDSDYGWAVGDLGTIWHTQNGGEIWRRQSTQSGCQLSSVHFVNRELGWAGGGFALPHTSRSVGIVLKTTNGGQTWNEVSGLLLPWLSRIHFSSDRLGCAAGLSTPLYPTGVWSTKDGGKTWSPIQGVSGHHWSDAAFAENVGVLASQFGKLAWLAGNRLVASKSDFLDFTGNSTFATLINDQIGLAGHGHPSITVDGGGTWHNIGRFPDGTIDHIFFDAMASFGKSCWLAGSPGTRIFFSHDHARTWRSSFSGDTLPIRGLYFVDNANGWAVGSCGLILRTEDGGRSWRIQRGGAKRAALLGVFADQRDIPWELLARASAAGDYRVHIAILAACPENSLGCPVEKRLQEASQRIGASTEVLTGLSIESLIDRSASDVIRSWKAELPHAMDRISERLTQLVRSWRPDVVVTSYMSRHGSDPKGTQVLTGRLIADACEFAASRNSFPDQLTVQGLQVWSVSRVLVVGRSSTQLATPVDELTAVGSRVRDLARRSQRLLTETVATEQPWSLVVLGANRVTTTVGTHPFSGLNIPYDSAARRRRAIRTVDLARQRQTQRRNLHIGNLLRLGGNLTGRGTHRIEQAVHLLESFDQETAGDLLYQLAEDEIAAGKFSQADQMFRHFIAKHSEHVLSDQALQWLVKYHTSHERLWRDQSNSSRDDSEVKLASAEFPFDKATGPADDLAAGSETSIVQQEAGHDLTPVIDWQQGFRLARELKSKRPALYAEPSVVFPVAAITRDQGQIASARAFFRRELTLPLNSWWRHRTTVELALLDRQTDSSATTWQCVRIDERPHLDGSFLDACWDNAHFTSLEANNFIVNVDAQPSAKIAIAHDDEFLYVAASCPKYANVKLFPQRRPRPRDANLNEMDRIQLSFDINRDYVSWWQFEIDHRGWTRESLMGDNTWNPKYYVASGADDWSWRIEVAIPLDELAPKELQSGSHWALGVNRLIPGKSIEMWNPTQLVVVPPDLQGVMRLE